MIDFDGTSGRIGSADVVSGDCGTSEASYLDSNAPNYQPGASTYTLVKLTGATTCAAVRAAAP